MVSSALLSILAIFGASQDGPNEAQLVASARRILTKAYSQTAEAPRLMFGDVKPRIEKSTLSKTVSVSYPGGMVSFSVIDGRPEYFELHLNDGTQETPWDEKQRRGRVIEFAREFMPGRAFLIESHGEVARMGFTVHPLEQGIPYFSGFWLKVGNGGIITHGGFPPPLPEVSKMLGPRERDSKENATATAVLSALDHDPELQTFEITQTLLYWFLPNEDINRDSPHHVHRARDEKKVIQAYFVVAFGRRMDDENPYNRKAGSIWIDAESGRAVSGHLVPFNQAGPNSKPTELKVVNRPKQLFIKKAWKRIESCSRTDKESPNPKGDLVLAKEDSVVVAARLDVKSGLLWLPSAEKWRALKVKY